MDVILKQLGTELSSLGHTVLRGMQYTASVHCLLFVHVAATTLCISSGSIVEQFSTVRMNHSLQKLVEYGFTKRAIQSSFAKRYPNGRITRYSEIIMYFCR